MSFPEGRGKVGAGYVAAAAVEDYEGFCLGGFCGTRHGRFGVSGWGSLVVWWIGDSTWGLLTTGQSVCFGVCLEVCFDVCLWMFAFVLGVDIRSPQLPEEEGDTNKPLTAGSSHLGESSPYQSI